MSQARTRAAASLAAAGLATVGLTAGLVGSPATGAVARPAAHRARGVPTVVARMTHQHIRLNVGHHLRPGRVVFKVLTGDGKHHELQLLRLHRGYTAQEAQSDFTKAFRGEVDAVRRLDENITFLGGGPTRSDKPGRFAVNLAPNRYMLVDQDGPAATPLTVRGKRVHRPAVRHSSRITALSYGFDLSSTAMPRSGWTQVQNHSDQPHFVVINRVKPGTTRRMVARYFRSGKQRPPAWAMKASTSTGVVSPYRSETFHYRLPAGRYVLMCFWPDDDTGMPHAYMGMWHLATLR